MKIIKKVINFKSKTFQVRMHIEQNTDDAWNLFNLISVGDLVYGKVMRKVSKETLTGLVQNEKKTFSLLLQVNQFEYDADTDQIRINGINKSENKYVGLGQAQSMDIFGPMKITIIKRQFDYIHVKKLKDIQNEKNQGKIMAITMEEGVAHVWMISNGTTKLKFKVEKAISKRKAFGGKTDKQINKFFETMVQQLEIHFNPIQNGKELLNSVKSVVIGSPGFYREHFYNHMKDIIEKHPKKSDVLNDLMSKAVLAHTTSGYKHSLTEILQNKEIMKKMNEVGCAGETALLDEFFTTLRTDYDKVCYGQKTVCAAMESVAVKNLLLSDHLFRSKNVAIRKQYVKIAEDAEKNGIKVSIFGSQNPSGQRLKDMTGIAAILKFALPELDDVEEDEANSSDEDNSDSSSDKESEQSKETKGFDDEQIENLLNGGLMEGDDESEMDMGSVDGDQIYS